MYQKKKCIFEDQVLKKCNMSRKGTHLHVKQNVSVSGIAPKVNSYSATTKKLKFTSKLFSEGQMQDLISAKFALENLFSKPNTVFLDATFHLPNSGRNALDEFNKEHIPNSRFFDIDKISNKHSKFPHMLPNENEFSSMVSEIGIKNEDTVVLYDNSVFFSSARAWWMFKIFGHF